MYFQNMKLLDKHDNIGLCSAPKFSDDITTGKDCRTKCLNNYNNQEYATLTNKCLLGTVAH